MEKQEQNNFKKTEYQIVKYKDTEYILEDNIIFKIKDDDDSISKGSKVGIWKDGEIKKGIKKDKKKKLLMHKKVDYQNLFNIK